MNLVEYTILYSSTTNDEDDKKAKRRRVVRNVLIGTSAVGAIAGGAYLGNKYLNKRSQTSSQKQLILPQGSATIKNNHNKPKKSVTNEDNNTRYNKKGYTKEDLERIKRKIDYEYATKYWESKHNLRTQPDGVGKDKPFVRIGSMQDALIKVDKDVESGKIKPIKDKKKLLEYMHKKGYRIYSNN